MERPDGRKPDELRKINVLPDFVSVAEGSFMIEVGKTRVLCNATIENKVPTWLKGQKKGWVTAEYSLLPRSTDTRVRRERTSISGRTQEIQRLIGRSLRGVIYLEALGERTVIIDCDVIEADGGTRTASVVGGFLAMAKALKEINAEGPLFKSWLSAISVGVLQGTPILDLCYAEDSKAEVDLNVVMTDEGEFVEIQGTGEEASYSRSTLNKLLDLGEKGCREWIKIQKNLLDDTLP